MHGGKEREKENRSPKPNLSKGSQVLCDATARRGDRPLSKTKHGLRLCAAP